MFNLANMQILAVAVVLVALWLLEAYIPFLPNRQNRTKHSLRNIAIGAFNAIIVAILFMPLFFGLTGWIERYDVGLLSLINLPIWETAVLAILLQDAWHYIWHRANHILPFLWRFHQVHHSDPEMDASTAVRFHTGEILISAVLRLGVIALLGLSLWHVLLYDVLLVPVILLHHSNIRFPEKLDSFYRLLFASPAMHRIHHSPEQIETNSNYGSIFSFWDRLAGSFRLRGKDADVKYGLNEYEGDQTETFAFLAAMPMKNNRF